VIVRELAEHRTRLSEFKHGGIGCRHRQPFSQHIQPPSLILALNGSPGQSNAVARNAFMCAHDRRSAFA